MKSRLDRDIQQLVWENGFPDTIAALARLANRTGLEKLFTRLDKIYTWMIKQ